MKKKGLEELLRCTLIGLYSVSTNIMFKIRVETCKLSNIIEPSWVVLCIKKTWILLRNMLFLDASTSTS